MSQFIGYGWAFYTYKINLKRGKLHTNKLFELKYQKPQLKTSSRKLVYTMALSASKMSFQTHADWRFWPSFIHRTDYGFFRLSWSWQWTHYRCNRSAWDAYAHYPISILFEVRIALLWISISFYGFWDCWHFLLSFLDGVM